MECGGFASALAARTRSAGAVPLVSISLNEPPPRGKPLQPQSGGRASALHNLNPYQVNKHLFFSLMLVCMSTPGHPP
jgi:hypothetical protein